MKRNSRRWSIGLARGLATVALCQLSIVRAQPAPEESNALLDCAYVNHNFVFENNCSFWVNAKYCGMSYTPGPRSRQCMPNKHMQVGPGVNVSLNPNLWLTVRMRVCRAPLWPSVDRAGVWRCAGG